MVLHVRAGTTRIGADGETRTPKPKHWLLRPACLPIPPHPHLLLLATACSPDFNNSGAIWLPCTKRASPEQALGKAKAAFYWISQRNAAFFCCASARATGQLAPCPPPKQARGSSLRVRPRHFRRSGELAHAPGGHAAGHYTAGAPAPPLSSATGLLTRNQAAYRAGRNSRVRAAARIRPPMRATALRDPPRNTERGSQIMASAAAGPLRPLPCPAPPAS